MSEEKVERSYGLKYWIGVILITLLLAIYAFLYPDLKSLNNIQVIKGILSMRPEYVEMGENPSFISIYLREYKEKRFDIRGCAFKVFNQNILIQMDPGDSIQLHIEGKDLDVNNKDQYSFNVLGIVTEKNEKLLTVSMVNECQNRAWKRILWVTPFIGLVIIVSMLRIMSRNGKLRAKR